MKYGDDDQYDDVVEWASSSSSFSSAFTGKAMLLGSELSSTNLHHQLKHSTQMQHRQSVQQNKSIA